MLSQIELCRKEVSQAQLAYEESLVQLLCQAYKDATGIWPHTKLEEDIYYAIRGSVTR